jgi:AcrR family transcriptional regulator
MHNTVVHWHVPAVKTHTPELRTALIDEAGRLLQREGAAAVTLRRLARATGTSTTAVYTLFGDKSGLMEQMYIEGFQRLTQTVTGRAATADPVDDLFHMGLAYRRAAVRSPHLYELMFSRPVPGFRPSTDALTVARQSLKPLVEAVARCIRVGRFRNTASAEEAAYHLWALGHGLVELEIHRTLGLPGAETERRYAAAMSATIGVFLVRGEELAEPV